LFKKWILEGLSVKVINSFKNVPTRTLRWHFHKFLNKPPTPLRPEFHRYIWLKADAKYFGKRGSRFSFCVILYKEGVNLIYWRFAKHETFDGYVQDFALLTSWGYTILGITSDWHKSLVGAVKYFFKGNIPHQRCLVHTQRYCRNKVTRNPKTEAGKQFLDLIYRLNSISSHYEKQIWITWFNNLYIRWEHMIKQRTYSNDPNSKKIWWYTHKNLRNAYRTVLTTTDHLFLYLDYDGLDKDTNGLESEFAHLTEKIHAHRGMSKKHKISAISWYIFLKSKERLGE
jgi:hypothetical protein